MKEIVIKLSDETAHRLEVCAAKDGQRLAEGIARLLEYLVERFAETKK